MIQHRRTDTASITIFGHFVNSDTTLFILCILPPLYARNIQNYA